MTSTHSNPADVVIDIGLPEWCWSRLGSHAEGVLSYRNRRGDVSLAVPYEVRGQQILIPLATFNQTGWAAVGAAVVLTVSGTEPSGLRWAVRAGGAALRMPSTGLGPADRARRDHPSNGGNPRGLLRLGLLLSAVRVRGFYETLSTPAPQPWA